MIKNRNHTQSNINEFVSQLLRNYAEDNIQTENRTADPPFFSARVWASIRQEQKTQQFWEIGIISARKWLFGLSFVALLFFFTNLVAIGLQPSLSPYAQTQSPAQLMEESDFVEEAVIGKVE